MPAYVANVSQAHEHHRAHLESLPESELSYPLGPKGNAAEVPESQRVTDEPLGQR
jgi:NADH dehydrogenase (ubiquinone) Fe-S protein 6